MGQTGEVLPLPGLLYVVLSVPVTSGEGPRGLWFCPSWAVKRPDLRKNGIHSDNPDFTSVLPATVLTWPLLLRVHSQVPAQMPSLVLATLMLRTVRKTQGRFHF